jgi:hypothetical protein
VLAAERDLKLPRAARVTADLCRKQTLPAGVSSVNLPKVAGGATVAVQQTQNSAVSETAMTTTSVSSGITTIAGMQIISLQKADSESSSDRSDIARRLAARYWAYAKPSHLDR